MFAVLPTHGQLAAGQGLTESTVDGCYRYGLLEASLRCYWVVRRWAGVDRTGRRRDQVYGIAICV